jgi:hypothetical protein
MNCRWNACIAVLLIVVLFLTPSAYSAPAKLSWKEAAQIAKLVFRNECDLREKCLLSWNDGENFLSLGLGHFIWYPAGKKGPFEESFPRFVEYVAKAEPEIIPDWLRPSAMQFPWKKRKDFLKDVSSPRRLQLEQFLRATTTYQVVFITERFYHAMEQLRSPQETGKDFSKKLDAILASPNGFYVLIDYINFKGEGFSPSERHRNQGWGLVQVLEEMDASAEEGDDAIREFVRSAKTVLKRRVRNVHWWQRQEKKWLLGWEKRLESYLSAEASLGAGVSSPFCNSIENGVSRMGIAGLSDKAETAVH